MLLPNNLSQLLKEEVTEFLRSTKDICMDNNPELLNITSQVNAVDTTVKKLDDALLYERESKFTEILEKLDIERDDAVMSIKHGFLMNLYHEDAKRKAAGQLLLDHLEGYGKRITKLNYEAESTVLVNLVDDYENKQELKKALQQIELTDRATRIKASNINFREKYIQRITAESAAEKTSFTALKPETIEVYTELYDHINAYAVLDKTSTYRTIKNELDTLGDRYLQILKTRRSNSNEPATEIH